MASWCGRFVRPVTVKVVCPCKTFHALPRIVAARCNQARTRVKTRASAGGNVLARAASLARQTAKNAYVRSGSPSFANIRRDYDATFEEFRRPERTTVRMENCEKTRDCYYTRPKRTPRGFPLTCEEYRFTSVHDPQRHVTPLTCFEYVEPCLEKILAIQCWSQGKNIF